MKGSDQGQLKKISQVTLLVITLFFHDLLTQLPASSDEK